MTTYTSLRQANIARQEAWCAGGDPSPDLAFRGVELAGEVGEALNVIKKMERERRGWRGSRASLADLADELADVVICADLVAISAGIDLDAAVAHKFNATSERVGLPQRLTAHPRYPMIGSVALDRLRGIIAEFRRNIGSARVAVRLDDLREIVRAYMFVADHFAAAGIDPAHGGGCSGADDPEERCPRHPGDCTCWQVDPEGRP